MPAFSVSGINSGQNTNDLVKRLVDLESKPIKRWEKENENGKIQIRAWNELKNQAVNLQVKVKALTSFTAPFSSKKLSSGSEGYVSGEAGRGAKIGKQEVEVTQLATKHKVAGEKIHQDTVIPEGSFTIVSKDRRVEVSFSGGDIEKLNERIKQTAGQVARSALTKVDKENFVLSMHAVQYGKEAELKFLDPNGVLKAAGLVGDNIPEPEPSYSGISFTADPPKPYQPEKFTLSAAPENAPTKADGISLKPGTAFIFPVSPFKVDKKMFLEISLKASNDGKISDFLGFGVTYKVKDSEKSKFSSVEQKNGKFLLKLNDFAKDQEVTGIVLANVNDKDLVMEAAKLKIPGEIQGAPAKVPIAEAQDAIFKVDGIEITRDTNENIRDAVDGASLNLLKVTPAPITVEVTADTSKGLAMFREFVEAYNNLMKYAREVSHANRDAKLDKTNPLHPNPEKDISAEYYSQKAKSGVLTGEANVVRLITGLKSAVSASYPSNSEPRYKVLSDIGITTGEAGTSWKQIQEGFLILNESMLQTALTEHPESVKELFASDTNDDNKIDDGLANALIEVLKPYTQFSSGIVSTKVKLVETQIQDNNKRIKEYESHLVNYEKKLKQKFEHMEQGVGRNKAVGNHMINSIKQMKANNYSVDENR